MVLDAIDAGDVATANALTGQLLGQLPNHPDVLQLAAHVLDRTGNVRQAQELRRKAIANSAAQRAAMFRAMGADSEARAFYVEALKVDTYNALACDALGEMNRLPTPSDAECSQFNRPPLNLFKTDIGTYYLPSDAPNDIIIRRMKAGQVFEAEIVETIRPYIHTGTTVIDVGSNLGQMAMIFSGLVGADGNVYAIEADPFIYHVFRMNLKANGCSNVTALNYAAYDHGDDTVLYPEQDFKALGSYGSYGVDPTATEGRPIRTMMIDSLTIEQRVSAIKVDIQGCDLIALRGAKATIERHKPAIIFEFEQDFQPKFGTSLDDYMAFVGDIGYRVEKIVNGINYLILSN